MTIPSTCSTPPATALGLRPASSLRLAGDAAAPARNPFSLVDLQARRVRYLRVSLTDRCNYRCTYCMPADGVEVVPRAELLSFAEIEHLVRLFVGMGVRKVRLTGGEPLVRRDVAKLVERIARIDGVEDLSMTTNGHLLAPLAKPLRDAGLHRLNVSLDSLDAARFATMTRRGDLARVLAGLEAAKAAGFVRTKLNVVVLRGHNDQELVQLCDFAGTEGHVLRFIEYMPIGVDEHWGPASFVAAAEVRAILAQVYELTPDTDHGHPGGGPAVYWRARRRGTAGASQDSTPDGAGVALGFIAAVSEAFCRLCNRVRLSPTGTLRECLSTGGVLSLRDMLRARRPDSEIEAAIGAALQGKVDGHRFDRAVPTLESMSAIGG